MAHVPLGVHSLAVRPHLLSGCPDGDNSRGEQRPNLPSRTGRRSNQNRFPADPHVDGLLPPASRRLHYPRTPRSVRHPSVPDPADEKPQPPDGRRRLHALRVDDHGERSVPYRQRRLRVLHARVVPAVHVTRGQPGHRAVARAAARLDVRAVLHARLSRHVPLLHNAAEDVLPRSRLLPHRLWHRPRRLLLRHERHVHVHRQGRPVHQ